MIRAFCLALTATLLVVSTGRAQPARFQFEKGQTLAYRIVQTTKINEARIDEQTGKPIDQEHLTKNTVVRQWKVADVDARGVATLEMTIRSIRWEKKLPSGEMDVFDSAQPDATSDKSVSDFNKQEMAKFVGPVLAVIRVDALGKIVEVKEVKFGSPNRFAVELPFKITLPDGPVKEGQTWDRKFTIKLEPPLGTGETYEATQKYLAKAPANNYLTIGLSTAINQMPAQAADQVPLLPMLLEGDVYFHEKTGRFYAARLKAKKELLNHAGEGSKYVFETAYVEDFIPEKAP
jgi:hypothetical protein